MPTHLLTLTAPERVATALADALTEGELLAADAAGAFDQGDGHWGLEAYFAEAPDTERLADAVTAILAEADAVSADDILAALAAMALRPLDGADWADLSLDSLPPIVAGRFRVFGEHNKPQPDELRRHDLVIEASTAFGTGDHASTQLALTALDAELKVHRPNHILDLGCGTGILALAAAKVLRAAAITASDIAAIAVRMSELNRTGNAVGSHLRIALADGLSHAAIRAGAPYDLVLANILPDPLSELAAGIVTTMAPGATLIIAGLRQGEERRLIAVYRRHGLVFGRRLRAKEWSALVFAKPCLARAPATGI
ncbi:MAG: 50S ribosomal protein L11 methyltransferase [Ancalomicrobiaceae bacterium]|nr:50S ribosomal protein L11 methyltransferase [Ancalomicrobiaceae bacterium]